jgi:hypothetical protein
MGLFTQLFGNLVAFAYHCFDRIVIYGYLTGLSRPDQVVHFFRQVVGVAVITKETLSQRTDAYQTWVEAFACNIGSRSAGPRRACAKRTTFSPGSAEWYARTPTAWVGPTFRITVPNIPPRTQLPHPRQPAEPLHPLLFLHPRRSARSDGDACGLVLPVQSHVLPQRPQLRRASAQTCQDWLPQERQRLSGGRRRGRPAGCGQLSPDIIRKRLDYWTFVLGPKFSAKERKQVKLSSIYAISQVEYCWNIIFKRNFPIHKMFERSCELGLWRLTAHNIAEIFGTRLQRKHRGKLSTIIEQIAHGHHVFRVYFRNAVLRQYEKFSTYLRNELCSNNLYDFGLKKSLEHLDEARQKFQVIISRFAGFQAQWLNVHVDFPLLQRMALPITIGSVRYPGIKIQDTRIIHLLEVLLHGSTHVGRWTAKEIHQAVLTAFHLSKEDYGLNQLRHDLRKLKGHALLERDGTRYAYCLTSKGVQVALLFLFFHKRLCDPLANSRFHHQPDPQHRPNSRLETAYHRVDKAIEHIVELLAAA